MTHVAVQFAEAASGLASLGLDWRMFLFQLFNFVVVLWLLKKFVYKRLVDTLESRRKIVLESLDNAKEAAAELEKTNEKTVELLDQARSQAADIVALAHKEAAVMVEDAEAKAKKRADHMIEQAESRLQQDIQKARIELRRETLALVATATETVLRQKVDTAADKKLIASALKEAE